METPTSLFDVLHALKKIMRFKSGTAPGDCILAGMPSGLFYGLVREIAPDSKKNWYTLSFTLLTIPPADVTWILRQPQMNGEIFTINNEDHFVIAVDTLPARTVPDDPKTTRTPRKSSHLQLAKK